MEPKKVTLTHAVKVIKQACEGREPSNLPYFFLVGAGISKPPIKLATEIIEDCRVKAAESELSTDPADKSQANLYSYWFGRAFPDLEDRRDYLEKLIRDKNISHANFRLAHLLLEKKLTTLVVTTNFDDFLLRALNLFGIQPILCDHPRMVERINTADFDDIQIIHVHGTYSFYDCINLQDEIIDRALPSMQTTSTMASLLDIILSQRVPIVLGYSGWEGDVVMSALRRRLNQGRLKRRLHWFCYQSSVIDDLPSWLKDHPDVYFVVPEPAKPDPALDRAQMERSARGQGPAPSGAGMKTAGGSETSLDARQVLDAINNEFKLDSPPLTSDPLKFFADRLRSSLPRDETGQPESDIYFIKNVIERIERARQLEQQEAIEMQLEKVREALRRSAYGEAIHEGRKIKLSQLSVEQQQDLLKAVRAATGAAKTDEEKLQGYDFIVEVGARLLGAGVDNPELLQQIAQTLFDRAVGLGDQGAIDAELEGYERVIKQFGGRTELAFRELVAKSLVNTAWTLGSLEKYDEAVKALDRVLSDFGDSTEPALQAQVAMALISKGSRLCTLKQIDEGVALLDDVVERYGDSTEPVLQRWVGHAILNMGYWLTEKGKSAEALAAYEEVISRLGDSTEPHARTLVAQAMIRKSVYLNSSDHVEQAVAIWKDIIARFGEATAPALRAQVAPAYGNLAFTMLCDAKKALAEGKAEAGRALLEEARKHNAASLSISPDNPIALGNDGYIAFLLGEKANAAEQLTRAFSLGGEKIREMELKDADIHPLPQDAEFKELVRSIPVPPSE